MCFAGSIRGAIAFGLAISIESNLQINREVLISTTLILVFFTTIVFGAFMPFVIKFFKQRNNERDSNLSDTSEDEKIERYSIERYETNPVYILFNLEKILMLKFLGLEDFGIRLIIHISSHF